MTASKEKGSGDENAEQSDQSHTHGNPLIVIDPSCIEINSIPGKASKVEMIDVGNKDEKLNEIKGQKDCTLGDEQRAASLNSMMWQGETP